jgi:hypothetical protein
LRLAKFRRDDDDWRMGIFNTLYKKQVHNGIFIALLVVFAIGIFIWWNSTPGASDQSADSGEHPLSNADSLALCNLLPPVSGGVLCQDAQAQVAIAGHSMWKDANGNPVLRADLITTQNLSMPEPQSSSMWFQNALPEIKASGRQDWDEPKGSWTQAVITRRDQEQEILLEDNGIVLILQTSVLDRAALLDYANKTANALRKAKPIISSAGDAIPR